MMAMGLAVMAMARPGDGIGRTMGLLKAGRPARILFYGQSITEQGWTRLVEADLRKRFPKATLVVENRAIGGFSADKLMRTARADVLAARPDLVIFHDYGGEPDYARLVGWIRARTPAEVLLQTDHPTWAPDPSLPNAKPPGGEAWHDAHAGWIAELAGKLGGGSVDVRSLWRAELATAKALPDAYLSDGVHLNDRGDALMARLVGAALVPGGRPGTTEPTTGTSFATTEDVVRVEARGRGRVMIDGVPPSSMPELWVHGRSTGAGRIPLLKRAGFRTLPVAETWTITMTSVEDGAKRFGFSLTGSVTGADGEGFSDAPFVSKSGRVEIEPRDWEGTYVDWIRREMEKKPIGLAVGDRFTFQTRLSGADAVLAGKEWTVVADGLRPRVRRIEATRGVTFRVWRAGAPDALDRATVEP